MSISSMWQGKNDFLKAQAKVFLILAVAYIGDNFDPSYPRNENHNMTLFWAFHVVLLILAAATWTYRPPRDPESDRVSFLSRPQTEEWKGWMQFAFIMYHYYRAWTAYNWIRVFVSSYVWMTGWGNYMYFDKKRDFSIERVVSMTIRINYFPLLLCAATGTPLDLYYVVPLHTVGFFMTLLTCRLGFFLEEKYGMEHNKSRYLAIFTSLLVHVLFYETAAVEVLKFFSDEIFFRFQADKYSAWLGVVCGFAMTKVNAYMSWAHGREYKPTVVWGQRLAGVSLIALWYYAFGFESDKYVYNPKHPYIFIIPLIGWLMLRNSSRYLTQCHSSFLEFLGRNTLETYVLQFHLFMNHKVQNIPELVPGSGPEGPMALRVVNMLVCGTVFVTLAVLARKVTVTTQTTVVELTTITKKKIFGDEKSIERDDLEEAKPMVEESK